MRGTSFQSAGHRSRPRMADPTTTATATMPPASGGRPEWADVEALVLDLFESRATFATTTSATNWISALEPDRRFMLETDGRSRWVQLEHVRECWETFERLGRITRGDVLEPGRCSAVMMGLFAQLPGVSVDGDALVLR